MTHGGYVMTSDYVDGLDWLGYVRCSQGSLLRKVLVILDDVPIIWCGSRDLVQGGSGMMSDGSASLEWLP